MSSIVDKIRVMLEPAIEGLGYELLLVELTSMGKTQILRLYIDAPGGIQVEDCEAVSRQSSAILDVEDPLTLAYNLEVSSPGLDRPLVKPQHFERVVGEQVKVQMSTYVLGRRRFTGELVTAGDSDIVVEVDGESYDLPYQDIESARLVPKF